MKREHDEEEEYEHEHEHEQDRGESGGRELKRRRGEGPHIELRMLLQSKVTCRPYLMFERKCCTSLLFWVQVCR